MGSRILKRLGGFLLLLIIAGLALGWQPDRDAAAMKAKYTNSASRFIDLGNGLNVHVRVEGNASGAPVLLVHGSNSSLHTWEPWVKRLGARYQIISLDLPGHGLTGPDPSRDYHYTRFVEVVDQTMTKLGVERFAIAGNSMGGGVAWHYAIAHPDRVTALGLIDAAGAPQWKARSVPLGFRLARMPVIRELAQYVTPRAMIEKSLHQSVSNQSIVTDKMVDRYWELLLYPGNRQATLDRFALVHNVEPASEQRLSSLKMPVLIMWGAEDALIPVSSADWFAKAIPAAKRIIYPNIGHVPMEENAGQSAADFDAFLASTVESKPKS